MADDDIEIGESIEVSEIIDESGEVIGVVVDDGHLLLLNARQNRPPAGP